VGYYLLPVADFTQAHIILRAECPEDRGQYRYATLGAMFGLGEGTVESLVADDPPPASGPQ